MCLNETCWSVDLNQLLKPSQKIKNQKLNHQPLLFTQVQRDLRETFHDETIRLHDILTKLKAISLLFYGKRVHELNVYANEVNI